MKKLIKKVVTKIPMVIIGVLLYAGFVLTTGYEDMNGNIQWGAIIGAVSCLFGALAMCKLFYIDDLAD